MGLGRDRAAHARYAERLRAAAKHLGCAARPDDVARACVAMADQISDNIDVDLLPCERLEALASHFSVELSVARTTEELDATIHRYAERGDLGFLTRRKNFDDDLLAAVLRRTNPRPEDRRFAALIDARDFKEHMAFFSKTHEVAHPALEPQLIFDLRDEGQKRDPWERLVDRVGSEMVFSGSRWRDSVSKSVNDNLGFSTDAIFRLRASMAPDASLTAIALAAANTARHALLVVIAREGTSRQDPKPVLRVARIIPSHLADGAATYIHQKRRIPPSSPLAQAHVARTACADFENLSTWRGSDGVVLPDRRIWTSAHPMADGTFGFIDFGPV